MMETRPVGRCGTQLSVIGIGTAQLQMLPERQAIDTLVRGFELGVNWVHTAPDYGGIDPWIRSAIETSRRQVEVLTAGPLRLADLPAFFENTGHVYRRSRLALYGLAGIEDIEYHGENVWGPGGMIEYLQRQKEDGRLGGIYCSTHGSPDYVISLIESGVFDAIMLAWNPLGFHQQSHPYARAKINRHYEDLEAYRQRVFPLAADRGVSLLIMKPFAGGLLCKSKALPPHDWYGTEAEAVGAGDVLRLVLEQPAVCAVVPGSCSAEEAEENARAGHRPLFIGRDRRARIDRAVQALRTTVCSRCGACETTCSQSLPIPAMFRDGYIWTLRNETNQATPAENYFDLHPAPQLACVTCVEQSCVCPQGIHIPSALGRVHDRVQQLRRDHQHPGPSSAFDRQTVNGEHRVHVQTSEVTQRAATDSPAVARFLIANRGERRWLAQQHDRRAATGIGIVIDGRLTEVVPLRNTICPGELSPLAFDFRTPRVSGTYAVEFSLMPLHRRRPGGRTPFHAAEILVEPGPPGATDKTPSPAGYLPRLVNGLIGAARRRYHVARFAPPVLGRRRASSYAAAHGADQSAPPYAAEYVEHSIPPHLEAGRTYGIRLGLRNTGRVAWDARPGDARAVHVLAFVDDELIAAWPLPRNNIRTGETVTLHVAFRAPEAEGPHRVRLELVQRGVTDFSAQGVAPWLIDVHVSAPARSHTRTLLEIERRHNPWHYNPLTGISQSTEGHPYPTFIARGRGCHVWDTEGNEFLDYTMGWGSTILGHADERIQTAIRDVLEDGMLLPFPHPLKMEVTRLLVEQFPGVDMVAFGKNGSDVCTIASRLARLITGRRTILSAGFHGWQDFALDYFAFTDCGVPFRDQPCLHKFRVNDRDEFVRLYQAHKSDLAAVMIEPAGAMLDEATGLAGEADAGFLAMVAELTRRAGALLIFDEIVTGFRYPSGSVQRATGVVADVTCVGKALASGMPLAALLGPYRVFVPHFHKAHFHPTFAGEIVSLAAARAAIEIYRTEPVADHIWRYGESLRRGVDEAARHEGVAGRLSGPPFRLAFVFSEPDAHRRQLKRTLLMQELLKQRVITVTGMMLPSYAHSEQTLTRTIDAFGQAFEVIAHADRRDDLDRYVELTLL